MSEKLSPEARDKLAARLRANLGGRRPRRLPLLLVAGVILVLLLTGVWFASQPVVSTLPPLTLTCPEAIDDDGWAEVRLAAPSDPSANLEGLEVHWQVLRNNVATETATTKTDRDGVARYRIVAADRAENVGVRELHAWFVDPAGQYRRDCRLPLAPDGDRKP
jgi:hypothetical protein